MRMTKAKSFIGLDVGTHSVKAVEMTWTNGPVITGFGYAELPSPDAVPETVLAPPVAARLAERIRTPAAPDLTSREVEVLRLVATGSSNAEIGRALFIGEATVKTHLVRAFAKLGVTDRTAAVTAAYRMGLIDLQG